MMKTMKKYIILLIILLLPINVNALEKKEVLFSSCIDGDTAVFKMNKRNIKVRFLAVDAPELKHFDTEEQPYAKEASNYTCKKLKNAKKIELEFDEKSKKKDKYNRYLAWVFIDDKLLQNELVKNGYVKVTYLYDDYKYIDVLKKSEKKAKQSKKGIYNDKLDDETIQKLIYNFYKKLKSESMKFIKEILKEIDKKSL